MFTSGVGGLTTPSCISLGFVNGVDPVRMVVMTSPSRCGVSLMFVNSVGLARTVVVLTLPHTLLLVASGGGDDGPVPIIIIIGLSSFSLNQCWASEEGGGAPTVSAGLCLLWLGLFEDMQTATAAVVICHLALCFL